MRDTYLEVAAIGVDVFDAALAESGTPFVRLDCLPPAGCDTGLVAPLFRLRPRSRHAHGQPLWDQANREAFPLLRRRTPLGNPAQPAHHPLRGCAKNALPHTPPVPA